MARLGLQQVVAASAVELDDFLDALVQPRDAFDIVPGKGRQPLLLHHLDVGIGHLERDLGNLKTEMARKILDSEMNLKRMLGDSHGTMLDHVAVQTSPRHGTLIFVIIGGQVALIAAYIWYERKKTLPKKYL